MKKDTTSLERNRKILGLSLSPELAAEVKVEAARRGLTLRKLFEEMWKNYNTRKPK